MNLHQLSGVDSAQACFWEFVRCEKKNNNNNNVTSWIDLRILELKPESKKVKVQFYWAHQKKESRNENSLS